jgi:CRP-like cAMP-binding protein
MISTELLRRYPLFARQTDEMLKQIAMLAQEKEMKADAWLFFEGEAAKTLYLIIEGGVDLSMNIGEIGERRIEKLEPLRDGEVVGWSAIIEPHVYTLGAQTTEDTHLIAFDGIALRQLMDDHPDQGYYFMKELAKVIGQRLVGKCTQLMSMLA